MAGVACPPCAAPRAPLVQPEVLMEGNMKALYSSILGVTFAGLFATAALAIRGADALKQLNHDSDQPAQQPEALDASTKVLNELSKDNDLTLDKAEVAGLVTDTEWKQFN